MSVVVLESPAALKRFFDENGVTIQPKPASKEEPQKVKTNKRYVVRYPDGELCTTYNLHPNKELSKQSAYCAAQRISGNVFYQDEDENGGAEVKIRSYQVS